MKLNRLTVLSGIAIGLAILAVFVLGSDDDAPRPTLTAEEIATLPDLDLMRRVRLDILARQLAGPPSTPPPTGRLPVTTTVAFEDSLYAIGQTEACTHAGGAEAVASAYGELGAPAVVASLPRAGAVGPALAKAGMELLRAAWVRQHASDFVGK